MLAGLSLAELENLLSPLPRFRAVQIYQWINSGVSGFDEMSNIPINLREDLKNRFPLYSGSVENVQRDRSAAKIIMRLSDGIKTEAVLLSDAKNRHTACLSTQAGCPMGCVFCKTGALGFTRNLTAAEITEQFLFLQQEINRGSAREKKDCGSNVRGKKNLEKHPIDNIVVMGMGEPLLNLCNLRKALEVISDPEGMNFSRRRITVSTCGIYEGLTDLAENGPLVRLALSLTTADEALRQKLMPVTSANPLSKIKKALAIFQQKGGGRVTLEVVLLGGVNSSEKDASSIAAFAKDLDTVVNLIPWNPADGLEFEGNPLKEPEKKEIENFTAMLESRGVKVTMRLKKGRKVMGACGQLG